MRRARRRLAAIPALSVGLALASLLSGCGDGRLWARYRAEREFWHARRQVDRLQLNPRFVSEADYDRAAAAFRRVTTHFPPSIWARADRQSEPYVADIALLSGRAAIALARIEDMRGRTEAAVAAYHEVLAAYRDVPPVALEAALARARSLERAGHLDAATSAWSALWRDFPLVDPETGSAIVPVLDAPLRVARQLHAQGRNAAADSVLRGAEPRYVAALQTERGRRAAPDLWARLGEVRAGLGDIDGAMDALRAALFEPAGRELAPSVVMTLAERAAQGGRTDSALVYARWAETGFEGSVRADALLLEGRIHEAATHPDSALDAYDRFITDYPKAVDAVASARFRRGVIFEGLGRWEQARTEFRTLVARHPTHELSFAALEHIVAWHVGRGELELARIEGRRGIETLERLIETQRDDAVQMLARRSRASIMEQVAEPAEACAALVDLWKRYPETPAGVSAAIRAAQIAETRLNDPTRALELYEDLAARAGNPDTQRAARAAAARLSRRGG